MNTFGIDTFDSCFCMHAISYHSDLAARKADQSRLAVQLDVLEQAEESLQGYAEGARFLLDAARQSKLKQPNPAHLSSRFKRLEKEVHRALAVMDKTTGKMLNYRQLLRHPA